MTTRELIQLAGAHWAALLALFIGLPLCAWLVGLAHGTGGGASAPWKYIYSVLVYAACIPGMFSAVLTGYTLFFSHENLLDSNPLVYFLPLASMIVTLVLIHRQVDFDAVPGFERLSGLMVMLACSFIIALAIQKTNIWIVFGGSIERLLVIAAAVFALLKWGFRALFRRSNEPREPRPTLTGIKEP